MAATTAIILYRGAGNGHIVGTRLLPRYGALSPSGGGGVVVPGPIYYPWPQGGGEERGAHSSLGSKRRAALSKALHEAAEEKEKPAKRQRVAKKARKHPEAAATEAPPAAEAVPRAIESAAPEPEPTPTHEPQLETAAPAPKKRAKPRRPKVVAGTGVLRGVRHSAIKGVLNASAGGRGHLRPAASRRAKTGRLTPEAIENPNTMDLLYHLIAA